MSSLLQVARISHQRCKPILSKRIQSAKLHRTLSTNTTSNGSNNSNPSAAPINNNNNNNNNSPPKKSFLSSISSSLTNLKSRHSIQSQRDRALHASYLFQSAKHQAHNPLWYATSPSEEQNKLKPDFRQIHAMISLHVWFIHRRLFSENKAYHDNNDTKKHDNLLLQEELFDNLWHDTKSRIRAQGVNELTVNKHLENAQRATFLHCTQYDHAFEEFPQDVEKRFEIICDAVWRHVIVGDDDTSDDLIRRIGAYVEYQLENVVFRLPDDYFEEGRIGWGNVPDLNFEVDKSSLSTDTGGGGGDDDNDADQDGKEYCRHPPGMVFFDNHWVEVLTDAGEPYYWNMETNQTKWEKPSFI